MDANGLKFWMLAEQNQWQIPDQSGVQYDAERRSLRLMSSGQTPEWPDTVHDATMRLERVPQTIDAFGNRAWWEPSSGKVMATGALPGEVELLPPLTALTDLTIGYDGVLYLAINGEVMLVDLRERWEPIIVKQAGFKAWRLTADPNGGVWVLDRTPQQVRLARVQGLPFLTRPFGPYASDVFRPCPENPHPPRLRVLKTEVLPAEETPVAIACSPQGKLALLTWFTSDGDARLRFLNQDEKVDPTIKLEGIRFPYSLAWVSEDRVALLFGNLNDEGEQKVKEAAVYSVTEAASEISPVGDIYPLRDYEGGPFLHGTSLPPHYPTSSGSRSAPLYHLSLPSFASYGEAFNAFPLDSGSAQTVWHRLYIEAAIHAKCGIKVFLAASNDANHAVTADEWQEHQFGEMFAGQNGSGIPRGAWLSYPSEIPFHQGLLDCPRERDRNGLFTVLIQRPNRRVRTLRGRFLHVKVALSGDGRATPEIAALRAYASRFSYLNRYLPELYHETEFGPEADDPGRSTQADFLERFLDNFEGILTPLEDRIASSYLLTDPRTTHEEALEWLGSWIGMTFDPAYSIERRRDFIKQAPQLYRRHGTLDGLKLALNVATGGAVSGGEIVVLENFRLRRTFATILGADLADEADPLLGGFATSGNSFVGDTLFLGDEHKKEFLSLFNADLPVTADEKAAIQEFFDRLAHRVTVLVHQDVEPQDLGLIRRVVEMETPAHVSAEILKATNSFMVGIASLVGVDSYLEKPRSPRPVRVGDGRPGSQIGAGDLLFHPPSLDPRLEAGNGDGLEIDLSKPVAVVGPSQTVKFNSPFTLDGSASHAEGGRTINRYIWTLIE